MTPGCDGSELLLQSPVASHVAVATVAVVVPSSAGGTSVGVAVVRTVLLASLSGIW